MYERRPCPQGLRRHDATSRVKLARPPEFLLRSRRPSVGNLPSSIARVRERAGKCAGSREIERNPPPGSMRRWKLAPGALVPDSRLAWHPDRIPLCLNKQAYRCDFNDAPHLIGLSTNSTVGHVNEWFSVRLAE